MNKLSKQLIQISKQINALNSNSFCVAVQIENNNNSEDDTITAGILQIEEDEHQLKQYCMDFSKAFKTLQRFERTINQQCYAKKIAKNHSQTAYLRALNSKVIAKVINAYDYGYFENYDKDEIIKKLDDMIIVWPAEFF